MGFRFRKTVKIAPGVKMNFGKKGITSFGVGNTNFGKRGVHQNFNIPGTGISYRSKLTGSSQKQRVQRRKSRTKSKQMSVTVELQEDGSVTFVDKRGRPLSENLVKEARRQNRELITAFLTEQSVKINQEIDELINLHLTTPAPEGNIIVNPKPDAPKLKKHGFLSQLSKSYKQKTDDRNSEMQKNHEIALEDWNIAEQQLRNNPEVMGEVLSGALSSIEWPKETIVSFDISKNGQFAFLDVDLPEIEDMPTQIAQVGKRDLKMLFKNRSQKQLQLEYLTHIHAIGFRLVGDVFAYLPSIFEVIFSGYSQRVNKKTGNIEDQYLYSVKVSREAWKKINFDNLAAIDVIESFDQFDLRRRVTKTGIITPIDPFGK